MKEYYKRNRDIIIARSRKRDDELKPVRKKLQDQRRIKSESEISARKERKRRTYKEWRKNNKDKIKESYKSWLTGLSEEERRERIRKKENYDHNRYLINKEKIAQRNRANKEQIRTYENYRLKNNIDVKLARRLRNRIWSAINRNHRVGLKAGSAVKDLGCSISKLKSYLASKFKPGMTWDNYGVTGWHIDHKIPLAFFDLTKREQFLQAAHYTNLQPLWAFENHSKSKKVIKDAPKPTI